MNQKNQNHKALDVGSGIVFGAALGIPFGLLFLDGNIALGMSIGMLLGIIVASIAAGNKRKDSDER